MSPLIRQWSSSSLRQQQAGSLNTPDGDASRLSACKPRQPASSTEKILRTSILPGKKDGTFQVFLAAADDRIDVSTHATYLGPPLLFDIGALQPDFSSLELAARMTLMFADEIYFSPLTLYCQRPMWNHNSLKTSALTFLRSWDVQYRCDVLPRTGWFGISSKGEAEDFLDLLRALYDGSIECDDGEGDEDWVCFSRRRGVLRVDLTARFVYRPLEDGV